MVYTALSVLNFHASRKAEVRIVAVGFSQALRLSPRPIASTLLMQTEQQGLSDHLAALNQLDSRDVGLNERLVTLAAFQQQPST